MAMQTQDHNTITLAKTAIPQWLLPLAHALAALGHPLFVVGGWVRDQMLGLPAGDIDLASSAPQSTLEEAVSRVPGLTVLLKDKNLGTLLVRHAETRTEAEYAVFRRESYRDGGAHRPEEVTLGATLEEDARRRDFTVNAMYLSLPGGKLTDPLGGATDCQTKTIRTTRLPQDVLREDGLRLLRLVRLAAVLDFTIHPDTAIAATTNAALLRDIAPERLQGELRQILLADTRYPGRSYAHPPVIHGLETLKNLALLQHLLPELAACAGVKQRADYHDFDVLEHCFHACLFAPADLTARLAALLHDVGKPVALSLCGTMLGHDKWSADLVANALGRLRFDKVTIERVTFLVRHHMFDVGGTAKKSTVRWFFARMGYSAAHQWVDLRRADFLGSRPRRITGDPAKKWAEELAAMEAQGVPDTVNGVAIDGQQIARLLNTQPGPWVGAAKEKLWRHVVNHPKANHTLALEGLVKRMRPEELALRDPECR